MVLKEPTEIIIVNIITIIIVMMRTVGDPSWAHSAAHPTESPPSHLLHSDLSYDRHDDDEAFPTQLPDDIHDQNYNVKV